MSEASTPTSDDPTPDSGAGSRAVQVLSSWRAQAAEFYAAHLTGQRGLVVAGVATGIIYLLLTLAFPITFWWNRPEDDLGTIPAQARWARPLLALGGTQPLNIWMGVLALVVIVALFGLQGLALAAVRSIGDARRARRLIFGFAIAFIAIQALMQPITSTDLYGYLARSYLIATLHQNPTISQATLLPGEYLVPHARPPAPYGPLWLLICGAVGYVAGDNLLLAMLLMKLLMALAAVAAIWLVMRLADRLLPGQRHTAPLFFAWSPLLILEAAGNGHNDIVMMVAVLASIAAIVARRPVLAFPLLALGVLIKYSVGALVPLWAVALLLMFCWRAPEPEAAPVPAVPTNLAELRAWRDHIDWRRVLAIFGGGGAISVAIAAVCYGPFWVGLKTFTGLGQQLGATYFNGSIAELIYAALEWTAPGPKAASLGSATRLLLYAVYAGYVLWQTRNLLARGPALTVTALIQAAGKVIFTTLVLVTFWYQPWYIVWLLPLAALAPDAILRRHAATLAFGGVLTYIVQYFTFVNQPDLTRGFFVQFFLVLVAFAPLLILRHGEDRGGLPDAARRLLASLSAWMAQRPKLVAQVMLGLVLLIAALLRLIDLGAPAGGSLLRSVSGSLPLSLEDAHGFDSVFALVEALLTLIFGPTIFAVLLPTALIGTLTVWLIYRLALEAARPLPEERRQVLTLLAALLAATAQWHVALSRSGVEVVLLSPLVALAALAFLRARSRPPAPWPWPRTLTDDQRQGAHLALAGAAMGLVCDLEPSLWVALLIFAGFAVVLWWRRGTPAGALALTAGALVAALPALWLLISHALGFTPGSAVLARTGAHLAPVVTPLDAAFWGQVAQNLMQVARVLVTQQYVAVGPDSPAAPILPGLTLPFVVLGAVLAVRNWRSAESRTLGALVALPFVVCVAVGAPPGVIAAATVLPVACLIPAMGLEAAGHWLASIPEVVAGPGRQQMFISRQSLLRVGLLLVIVVATVSTFFWYFASTLPGPTHQVNPL